MLVMLRSFLLILVCLGGLCGGAFGQSLEGGFPLVNGQVRRMIGVGGSLYLAGDFSVVGGQTRYGLAEVKLADHSVTAWNPSGMNFNTVQDMILSPSGGSLYVLGNFTTIGGQARSGLAEISLSSGAATAWNPEGMPAADRYLAITASTLYTAPSMHGYRLDNGKLTGFKQRFAALGESTIRAFTASGDGKSLYVGWNSTASLCDNAPMWGVGAAGTLITSAFGDALSSVDVSALTLQSLNGLGGPSNQWLFAVGDGGTLLERKGGAAWRKIDVSMLTTQNLRAITLGANYETLYAVGDGGTILKGELTMGDYVWSAEPLMGVSQSLRDMAHSEVNGYSIAVGDGGRIIDNVNNPAILGTVASPTTQNLRGVWVASDMWSTVWAVGDGGTLVRRRLDMMSMMYVWESVSSPTTQNLTSVFGTDVDHVWAAGDNGTLLFFNGATWVTLDISALTTAHLRSIRGSDFYNITLVGDAGLWLQWDGHSWRKLTPITGQNLHSALNLDDCNYIDGTKTAGTANRTKFAALDSATGRLRPFDVQSDGGGIFSLLVKGNTLYVGGGFNQLGSTPVRKVARFQNELLDSAFLPNVTTAADNNVRGLFLEGTHLYMVGEFSQVGSAARNKVAAIDTTSSSGALITSWGNIASDIGGAIGVNLSYSPVNHQLYLADSAMTQILGASVPFVAAVSAVDRCAAVSCAPAASCQKAGVCDPRSGQCSYALQNAGFGCDDGNSCTTGDVCSGGGVCAGTQITCSALDSCHEVGVCSAGVCSNPVKNSPECGRCAQVTCLPATGCNKAGVCDPDSGQCTYEPQAAGFACDDGNSCTTGDVCSSGGVCAGSVMTCLQSQNKCLKSAGVCQNGACVYEAAVTCSAADSCHDAGTCSAETGLCSNPAKSTPECSQTDRDTPETAAKSGCSCQQSPALSSDALLFTLIIAALLLKKRQQSRSLSH